MITIPSEQILITSLNKAVNLSKSTGKLDLKILYIYILHMKYIEFTEGKEEFNTINKDLKDKVALLKYKYPHIICDYKLDIDINPEAEPINTPPTVDDVVIDLEGEFIYKFKIEDFTSNYHDAEFNPYNKVKITPPPISSGPPASKVELYRIVSSGSGTDILPITNTIEISVQDIPSLRYVSKHYNPNIDDINKNETDYIITFKISDRSPLGDLYSIDHTVTLVNSEYQVNYPPTIGDIFIEADNNVTTILTLNMFTAQMTPPYNDPENDLLDAIRIDHISNTNQGVFLINGIPAVVGDIITREDLNNNVFTHVGNSAETLSGDSIEFSARDEGSQQWVQ